MKPWPDTLCVLSLSWALSLPVVASTEESLPAFWVNDDLNKAFAQASKTGKPLLIVFRCLP